MLQIQRLSYKLLIPMLLFIPVWTAMGRGLFGVGGWAFFLTFFFYAPVVFIALLAHAIITLIRPGIRQAKVLTYREAILALVTWSALFLFQLFLVDGGDTEESVNSVFSKVFGGNTMDVSSWLSFIFMWVAIVSYAVLLTESITLLVRARRKR